MKLSPFLLPVWLMASAAVGASQSLISPKATVTTSSTSISTTSTTSSSSTASTKPLPRHVPVCHRSKSACQSSTNSCSGRGSCYLKMPGGKDGNEDLTRDCWTCACKSTLDGAKRTYWGGSACQKEDISSEFALLAGTTIALISIVTFGIGILYSVGSESLPGVIAAGVGSTKPR